MFLTDSFQNAYVTRDLDATVKLFQSRFGFGDFIPVDVDIDVMTPHGTGHSACRAAMGWSGSYMVEIIQPLTGSTVDIYSDFLPDDNSPRHHHIAIRTFDWEDTRKQVETEGWTIAVEHHMDEGLNFMYIDCRETLGHYVEYIWAVPDMWAYMGGQ